MTDLATDAPDTSSLTLDPPANSDASGGGAPRSLPADEAKPEKPVSLRDTIADAMKEDKPADAPKDADKEPDAAKGKEEAPKGQEKPEDGKAPAEAKEQPKAPERGPDGKFAGKEPSTETPAAEAKPDPDKRHIEAPTKFLPDAKETWRNTPRAVQRDVENMVREHETEVARHREAAERYEPIRQFDEVARQNGRAGVHESLREVAEFEDLMAKNPLAALNQILLRAGPRKADGQPVSLFELAQYVVGSGQDNYNKLVSAPAQQQPQRQPDPEVAQLKAQLNKMQEQTIEATVIAPFKAAHPRYGELQTDIAFFLKSGRIPDSLSPQDRLEAAYDMAVRINPASHADPAPAKADPDPGSRAGETFSDSKSIKSAPGAVSPELEPERGGTIRDTVRSELRKSAVR